MAMPPSRSTLVEESLAIKEQVHRRVREGGRRARHAGLRAPLDGGYDALL